jgi:hypothetical protein
MEARRCLEEIMTEMAWQKHTTRAMLSAGGSLTKKHGLVVTSEKVGDQRTYFIKSLQERGAGIVDTEGAPWRVLMIRCLIDSGILSPSAERAR